MHKSLLIVVIVVLALALGIGGGFAVSKALPPPEKNPDPVTEQGAVPSEEDESLPQPEFADRFGLKADGRGWMEKGSMPPGQLKKDRAWPDKDKGRPSWGLSPWEDDFDVTGERITLEEATRLAQQYATTRGSGLRVARMYEFENAFYAVVQEEGSSTDAFQLIIQPVSGRVRFENGPCMNWNTKYGRRMETEEVPTENKLSMAEAAAAAQQKLDDQAKGVIIDPAGMAFHGYYTFEYKVDGVVAGLISVNAEDGDYWFHNWLGKFISREDIEK